MASSLIIDWLNENELRAFPLKETANRISGAYTLPDNVLVDAQFTYSALPANVELESIVTTPTDVTFNVTGGKVFVADKTQPFPQYLRLSGGSLLVVSAHALEIPDSQTYLFTGAYFEDSVFYEWNAPWDGVVYVKFDATALSGDIELESGLQFEVDINEQDLILQAGRGYGLPLDCTSFGGVPDECTTPISYVNGAGPSGENQLIFNPGANTVVLDDPENHRIFVGFVFAESDICPVIYENPT